MTVLTVSKRKIGVPHSQPSLTWLFDNKLFLRLQERILYNANTFFVVRSVLFMGTDFPLCDVVSFAGIFRHHSKLPLIGPDVRLALVGQFERAPQTSSNAFVNSFAAYKLICYATAWKRKCVPCGHVILFVILFVNLTHQSAKMIYIVFSFMIAIY